MKKCLVLFNGGIDSVCATLLVQELQLYEILLLNFTSPFFGNSQQRLKEMAKLLKLPILCVPLNDSQLQLTCNPKRGYGAQANPCIDCKANMLKHAFIIMKQLNYDFIVTGDVIKQHPISQSFENLQKIDKISQIPDVVIRPLSQRLLSDNQLINRSIIDKTKMLAIAGQNHKVQEQLMKEHKINFKTDYQYCQLLYQNFVELVKIGRPVRYQAKQLCILFKGGEVGKLQDYLELNHLDQNTFCQQFCFSASIQKNDDKFKQHLICCFDFRNISQLIDQEKFQVQQFPDLEDQLSDKIEQQKQQQGYAIVNYANNNHVFCKIENFKQQMGQLDELFKDFIMKLSLYCSNNNDHTVLFENKEIQINCLDDSEYQKNIRNLIESKFVM